jgi:hypothetical protein
MDALTKPKRKTGFSASTKSVSPLSRSARPRPRAGEGRSARPRRPPDQQRHRDAPAGALAVPRRHRGEGPQGVPVHQRHRLQGPQVRHPGAGRRARRQPRNLPHRRQLPFEEIDARWVAAAARPLPPRIVDNAPCHEIVITGKELDKPGKGLDGLPIPISTPGWDIAPYATLSQYITKDPDTGVQNMGNYRGQVKARRRLGMNPSLELRPGIYNHWEKLRERGFKKLPCAVVLGAPPVVTFASVQKAAETLDELHVAGALVGAPINVVKAKTVDLLVPAEAEIVIEGFIDTEYLGARGAVRRVARPCQPAGVQRRSWTSPPSRGVRTPF